MNANCHHPPYTAAVEPSDGTTFVRSHDADCLLQQLEAIEDPMKPLYLVGWSVFVNVIECSWCRNPDHGAECTLEVARRPWWRFWQR